MPSKTNNSAIIKQIDDRIKWIIENKEKFLLWMPLAAFAIGGIFAFVQNKMKKTTKMLINETCAICYTNPRSIII